MDAKEITEARRAFYIFFEDDDYVPQTVIMRDDAWHCWIEGWKAAKKDGTCQPLSKRSD